MNYKFLLLQVRNGNDPAKDEEYEAFIQKIENVNFDLQYTLTQYDVLNEPLGDDLFDSYDIIFVGGSGEYSVLDDHPKIN